MVALAKSDVFINELEDGLPGVSPRVGARHSEACLVCFASQKHASGIEMEIQGAFDSRVVLNWNGEVTEQISKSWDEREATDAGACGIAFLLILRLTEFTVIERSRIGTGFDYFLGKANAVLFDTPTARLEVSGIRQAKRKSEITRRVKEKLNQTDVSDAMALPAYVVVVEFGKPISHVVLK